MKWKRKKQIIVYTYSVQHIAICQFKCPNIARSQFYTVIVYLSYSLFNALVSVCSMHVSIKTLFFLLLLSFSFFFPQFRFCVLLFLLFSRVRYNSLFPHKFSNTRVDNNGTHCAWYSCKHVILHPLYIIFPMYTKWKWKINTQNLYNGSYTLDVIHSFRGFQN